MRRILLCVLAAVTAAVPGGAQSSGFESRPLSGSALQNAIAFTRVLGYVQYFHPSDQAAATNWAAFAVAGMKQVEDAATPGDLAGRITALFAPIAPSVLVFANGQKPEIDPALHPADTTGLSVVRWDYLGFPSNPPSSNSPYKGTRIFQAVTGGSIPFGYTDPASGFEADVGAGISCFVPVVLYSDARGTLPWPAVSQPALPGPPWSVSNRAVRLSIVAAAWNIAQHFYPYFEVVDTDWLPALSAALSAAAVAADEPSMWNVICRLGAALHDGHVTGNTYRNFTGPRLYVPPLAWDWIEGTLVVTYVADSQGQAIQAGDAILAIDGTPVTEALAAAGSLVSASSRQYLLYASLARVAAGPSGTPVQLEIESGGSVRTVTMRRTQYTTLYETLGAVPEPRPPAVAELEPGIFYVDVSRASQTDWNGALSRLTAAKGIVIDYRGYPQFFPVSNFTRTRIPGLGLWMAKPSLPDQKSVTWQNGGWDLSGAQPWLPAKAVFLTDGRAISAAETALVIVESNKLGEIVGSPTAGSDGYVTWFSLFNLYGMGFTGEIALKPDGSQIHGIGSLPSIPLQRTRAGVAEHRDEVLERGLALLRDPGSRPVGPWVASAASWLPDSASPGAILSILAPAFGPRTGVGAHLTADGRVDTFLNDTRVFFDDIAAPLLYVGPAQVNAVVPYGVASKRNVRMRVEYQGQETLALGVGLAPSAPAIFAADGSGRGQGAILNQDQTPNSTGNPADRGSVISLFATGGGLTDIPVADGSLTSGALPAPRLPVSVRIGGVLADVKYAGAAPGRVAGALQVNVRIPLEAAPGAAAVFLTIGDATSQPGITVRVR